MFDIILHSESYCPDQIKIYPCEVMDWTDIKKDYETGTHIPRGTIFKDQEMNPLIELLIDEYFLQYVTQKNELIGFLRLMISDNAGKKSEKVIMKLFSKNLWIEQ